MECLTISSGCMEVKQVAVEELTLNLTRECPVCGKKFLPVQLHSWKDKTDPNGKRLVCTYHCMRVTERLAEVRRTRTKRSVKT